MKVYGLSKDINEKKYHTLSKENIKEVLEVSKKVILQSLIDNKFLTDEKAAEWSKDHDVMFLIGYE